MKDRADLFILELAGETIATQEVDIASSEREGTFQVDFDTQILLQSPWIRSMRQFYSRRIGDITWGGKLTGNIAPED